MQPPTDPDELDRYVLDLVTHRRVQHQRFEVAEVEYVRTSRGAATGWTVADSNREVYFIQVSGQFSAPPRSRSRRSLHENADVPLLSCIIDVRSGEGLGSGAGGEKVDMSRLGNARRLSAPAG